MGMMRSLFFEPIRRIQLERANKLAEDEGNAKRLAAERDQAALDYESGLTEARRKAQLLIQEKRQASRLDGEKSVAEARQKAQAELDAQLADLAKQRDEAYAAMAADKQSLVETILAKLKGQVPAGVGH